MSYYSVFDNVLNRKFYPGDRPGIPEKGLSFKSLTSTTENIHSYQGSQTHISGEKFLYELVHHSMVLRTELRYVLKYKTSNS